MRQFDGTYSLFSDADVSVEVLSRAKKMLAMLQNGTVAIAKIKYAFDDGTVVTAIRTGSQYKVVVEPIKAKPPTICSCVETKVENYVELVCPESTGVVSLVLKGLPGGPYATSPLEWEWMGAAPYADKVYIFLAREESAATFPFNTTYYMRIVVFDTTALTFTLVFDGLHPLSTGILPWSTVSGGAFRGSPMYAYQKNGQLRIIVGGTNYSNFAFSAYGFMTQVFEYVIGVGVVEYYAADTSAIGSRTTYVSGGVTLQTFPAFLMAPPVDNSEPGTWKQVTFAPVWAYDGTVFITTYDYLGRKWTVPTNAPGLGDNSAASGGYLNSNFFDISPQNGPGVAQPWMRRYSRSTGAYKQIDLPFAQSAFYGTTVIDGASAQICCCVLVAGGQQDNSAFGTLAYNEPDIWSVNLQTGTAKHVGLMPWGNADPWHPVAGDTDYWVDGTVVVATVNGFAVFTTRDSTDEALIPHPTVPNTWYRPNRLRAFMVK